MTSRRVRTFLVGFLLIVGAAGAYLCFDTYRRHAQVFAHERAVLARLDAMLASVNELAVTQRGYFEPARGGTSSNASSPQFQRVRQLTEDLKENLTSLRTQVADPDGLEQLSALAAALDDFSTTDTRVRTNLANDTYFSAADLVFSASAMELRSVTGALIALKELTTTAAVAQYNGLQQRAALTAATVGLVWLVGLLLLAPRPRAEQSQAPPAETETAPSEAAANLPVSGALDVPEPAPPALDLEAVARVCATMAKATSAAELREVMADAADTVGASGMIVWLGAGEELFPVLGHGYDPRMLARIGPLSRQASNATTLAWRTADTQIVPGAEGRAGAIVVPLISPQGCIGVLSAEVSTGREGDAATRAVTVLFAAQLSTIVAAWPEPSAAPTEIPDSHTGTIAVTL